MNLKEKFICNYCTQIFKSPVFLGCCGGNICKEHIDELISANAKTCPFCSKDISNQAFHVNKTIEDLIEMDIDKFKMDSKYINAINDLKKEFNNFKYVLDNPELIIKDYFAELKRQVDFDRETLKTQIDARASKYIEELSSYEEVFKNEYKSKLDLAYYSRLVDGVEADLNNSDKCLNSFANEKWEQINYNLIEKIEFLKSETNELELKLLANKSVTYEPMRPNIQDYFGRLIVIQYIIFWIRVIFLNFKILFQKKRIKKLKMISQTQNEKSNLIIFFVWCKFFFLFFGIFFL